jgi:hypothetical protein
LSAIGVSPALKGGGADAEPDHPTGQQTYRGAERSGLIHINVLPEVFRLENLFKLSATASGSWNLLGALGA